jgi:hypothetical protein
MAPPRLARHERHDVVEDFSGGATRRIGGGRIDQRAAISISRRKRFGTERHGQLRPQHLHRDLDLRQVGPRPATSRSRASMRCRALCVEWCVDQCRHGSKSGGAHPGTSRGLSMICRTEVGLPTGLEPSDKREVGSSTLPRPIRNPLKIHRFRQPRVAGVCRIGHQATRQRVAGPLFQRSSRSRRSKAVTSSDHPAHFSGSARASCTSAPLDSGRR